MASRHSNNREYLERSPSSTYFGIASSNDFVYVILTTCEWVVFAQCSLLILEKVLYSFCIRIENHLRALSFLKKIYLHVHSKIIYNQIADSYCFFLVHWQEDICVWNTSHQPYYYMFTIHSNNNMSSFRFFFAMNR